MAFQYADFETLTGEARLTRCRQHLAELRAMLASPDTASDGQSVNYSTLQQLLQSTQDRLVQLEKDPASRTYGGVSRVRIV